MARTPREVRDAIAEAIRSSIGADGWTESSRVSDLFPTDPRTKAHHAFAVTVPSTVPIPPDHRQRRDGGAVATTTITLRWAHHLNPLTEVGDYGEALDAEGVVIEAALSVTGLVPTVLSARRSLVADGTYVVGTVELSVTHSWSVVG